MPETKRDPYRWLILGACLVVAASQIVLVRQNRALKEQVRIHESRAREVRALRDRADRLLYERTIEGQCRPFHEPLVAAAAPERGYDVALYFSIEHDCSSCVSELVKQWNEVAAGGAAVRVRGYTFIDGTRMRRKLEEELRPLFPVDHVDDLEKRLAAAGMKRTPVALVSDAATGRILFTQAPLPGEPVDRTLVDKLAALAKRCG